MFSKINISVKFALLIQYFVPLDEISNPQQINYNKELKRGGYNKGVSVFIYILYQFSFMAAY